MHTRFAMIPNYRATEHSPICKFDAHEACVARWRTTRRRPKTKQARSCTGTFRIISGVFHACRSCHSTATCFVLISIWISKYRVWEESCVKSKEIIFKQTTVFLTELCWLAGCAPWDSNGSAIWNPPGKYHINWYLIHQTSSFMENFI